MPSILSDFQYDIFISYRHNDNRSGWVTEFVNALEEELASTIKEPLTIYFDKNPHDGLLETLNVDKSLEGKLKCLIFIPIISQTYCDTKSFAWQHEFVAFNKLASGHFPSPAGEGGRKPDEGKDIKLSNGNVASRILPIKIHDLDAEDKSLLESELGGVLRAIEFIYKESGVNRPLKSTDSKTDNQNKTDYRNQVNKVANAIKEIITSLKNPTSATRFSEASINRKPATGKPAASNKKILIGVVALLVAILSFFAYQKFSHNTSTTNEPSIDRSIAVLPFVNMSNDEDQEYFSDGLSEELLNLLAKIPELKVIARTSSFSFKGKNEDLRTIGEKLGVAHILEGSVRKSGNTLRITAQLIRVEDGMHLWNDTYDRTLEDIFKVQDEIGAAVVAQLKLKLLQTELPQAKTANTVAYNLWLEGKYFHDRRDKENYVKAIEKYNQALALDSTFTQAWASLALVYANQALSGYVPIKEGFAKARAAVDKALRLDPQLSYAHAIRGLIYINYDWDWAQADASIKKALELDPKNAIALSIAGNLTTNLGHLDEAISFFKQAIDLDPLRAATYLVLSNAYYYDGRLEEAEAAAHRGLELIPAYAIAHYILSRSQLAQNKPEALESIRKESEEIWRVAGLPLVYYKLNRKAEADASLNELIKKFAEDAAYQIAEAYAYRGEKENAFEWLERAFQQRDAGITEMKVSPLLNSLHSDARWLPFLKKMKLE